jgi:hypothetical protein
LGKLKGLDQVELIRYPEDLTYIDAKGITAINQKGISPAIDIITYILNLKKIDYNVEFTEL